MKFIRYSIIVDDCDYQPVELKDLLRRNNHWLSSNSQKFDVLKGYYPKELVIATQDLHTLNVLSGVVTTLVAQGT